MSAIKDIELKIGKFFQYKRNKGLMNAIRVSFARLFPQFNHDKNVWGLQYALNMPTNPIYQKYLRSRIATVPRLQLGAGVSICPNWLHQDVKRFQNRKHRNLDFSINVFRLKKYILDNSLEAIFTSHMLEHLSRPEAKAILYDCYRWLKPGGELWISVPDLSILYDIARAEETSAADRNTALMLISTPRPGHISCWLYGDLKFFLESLGFQKIQRWVDPPNEFQKSPGDWSYAVADKLISLNVLAIK
jgi:hypothetical protein